MLAETTPGSDNPCDVTDGETPDDRSYEDQDWLTPAEARVKLKELNPYLVIPTGTPHAEVMKLLNWTLDGEY